MKRVVKLIFSSIVGMLLAWTISFLFFYVFSYQLEWFSFQYQRELLAAVLSPGNVDPLYHLHGRHLVQRGA